MVTTYKVFTGVLNFFFNYFKTGALACAQPVLTFAVVGCFLLLNVVSFIWRKLWNILAYSCILVIMLMTHTFSLAVLISTIYLVNMCGSRSIQRKRKTNRVRFSVTTIVTESEGDSTYDGLFRRIHHMSWYWITVFVADEFLTWAFFVFRFVSIWVSSSPFDEKITMTLLSVKKLASCDEDLLNIISSIQAFLVTRSIVNGIRTESSSGNFSIDIILGRVIKYFNDHDLRMSVHELTQIGSWLTIVFSDASTHNKVTASLATLDFVFGITFGYVLYIPLFVLFLLLGCFKSKGEIVTEGLAGDVADVLDGAEETFSYFSDSKFYRSWWKIISFIHKKGYIPEEMSSAIVEYTGLEYYKVTPYDFLRAKLCVSSSILRLVDGQLSASALLLGHTGIRKYVDLTSEFLSREGLICYGVPEEGMFPMDETVYELSAHISDMEEYSRTCNPSELRKIKQLVNKCAKFLDALQSKLAGQRRVTPFAFIVHGKPGQGKNYSIENFTQACWNGEQILKGGKRAWQSKFIFHRNHSSEYWEGIQRTYFAVHLSELADNAAHLLKRLGDIRLNDFLCMCDCLPFSLNMADLARKGAEWFSAKVVCVDTNVKTLGVEHHKAEPRAHLRRPIYIEQRIKPDYCYPGTIQLRDEFKGKLDPFLWEFKIERFKNTDSPLDINTLSVNPEYWQSFHPENDWIGYKEAYILVTKLYMEHMKSQNALNEDMKGLSAINDIISHEFREQICTESATFDPTERIDTFNILCTIIVLLIIIVIYNSLYVLFLMALLIGSIFVYHNQVYPFPIVTKFIVWYRYYRDLRPVIGNAISLNVAVSKISETYQTLSDAWNYYKGFYTRIKTRVAEHKFTILVVFVVTVFLLYLITYRIRTQASPKSEKLIELEEKSSCGYSYKRVKIKNLDIWNTVHNEFSPSDKNNLANFAEMTTRGCRKICVRGENNYISNTWAFGLKGDIYLINTHAIGNLPHFTIKVANQLDDFAAGYRTFEMERSSTLDIGNDLTMIRLHGFQTKDRLKHVVPLDMQMHDMEAMVSANTCIARYHGHLSMTDRTWGNMVIDNAISYTLPGHMSGMCGLPVVARVGDGNAIIGLHCAGDSVSHKAYATMLRREDLEEAYAKIYEQNNWLPILSERDDTRHKVSDNPHHKSLVRFENLNTVEYRGTLDEPILVNNKSSLQRTPFAKVIGPILQDEFGYERKERYSKPLMQPVTRNGEYISPINVNIRKMESQHTSLSSKVSKRTFDCIVKRIKELEDSEQSLAPLTFDCAINGAPEDPFIRRINQKTAAGYPFSGPKKNKLLYEEGDDINGMPDEEIEMEIESIIDSYMSGVHSDSVYSTALKDEPRPIEKCLIGKTRIFYIPPFAQLILSRMYLGPFFSQMVEKSEKWYTAVGINMAKDADDLVKWFLDYSSLFMEGDYSNYDISIPAEIREIACLIIIWYLEYKGYNEFALKMVTDILSDNMYITFKMLNDLLRKYGFQPSGMYGTAEFNSLIGLILMVYAYISLTDRDDFFDMVRCRTYGDDVLSAVKPEVSDAFNNITYRDFCRDVYKMTYTTASKDDNMQKFISIHEASFLKRNFKYSENFDRWLAPISSDTLYKMLEWRLPSKSVSPFTQMKETCVSFLYELFLHVDGDESQFNRIRQNLIDVSIGEYGEGFDLPLYWDIANKIFC